MNLWDEKNLTDLGKNFSHNNGLAQNGTMTDIKIDCEKIECNDTGLTRTCPKCGGTIVYASVITRNRAEKRRQVCIPCSKRLYDTCCTRSCPKCGKQITYANSSNKRTADRKKQVCVECSNKIRRRRPISLERTCPQCNTIITYTNFSNYTAAIRSNTKCKKCAHDKQLIGRSVSSATRCKMSASRLGRPMSESTRQKHRERYKISSGLFPKFNPTACEYFDWLNMWNGWNGVHAKCGGEKKVLKYFVDYYEPSHNIVIEWDEPHHHAPTQKAKDVIRQSQIKAELGCTFYRYDVLTGTFYTV